MNQIERDIDKQLSHVFAAHGDEPDELFFKLRCLVLEWFIKGTAVKISQHEDKQDV